MAWSPPDGFIPAPSAVEGVTVYAPGASASETRPVCPRCGAPAGWNPQHTRYGCTRCEWSEALTAVSEGPGTFTPAALRRGDVGWGATRGQTLHCDGCGADVSMPQGTLATTCAFCGSAQLRSAEGEPGLRPHAVLPFAVRTQDARDAAVKWLGSGWWHPGDLGKAAVSRLSGVYLPAWRFGAHVHAGWRARVGYTETYPVQDHQGRTHLRTRVRWRNEDGEAALPVSDLLIPGSADLPAHLFHGLFPADMGEVRPYQPELLAEFSARAFTLPLAEAWELGRHQMRAAAQDACHAQIRGDHVQDFAMRADFREETWEYLLLPVYVSAFQYGDKLYQVVVDGRSGRVVGPKPVSWSKVTMACVLALVPGLVGLILPPVGIALLLVGIGFIFWIITSALRAEKGGA